MLSTCPKCEKQVSIPPGTDASVAVRCPLCEAEYPLSEALSLLPPELIVVGGTAVSQLPTAETAVEGFVSDGVQAARPVHNEAAAIGQQVRPLSMATRVRGRRHKSAIQTLIEVVLGGVAGIVVAYYGLAFFYRSEFRHLGLPQLPLPFISSITAAPNDGGQRRDQKGPKEHTDSGPAAFLGNVRLRACWRRWEPRQDTHATGAGLQPGAKARTV
ncbi:MAG: hypothetical protein LLG00_13055 [Planctomycetaceae bacterium]|nr:hypothetical protein [Planctomycetaceae bacterium]